MHWERFLIGGQADALETLLLATDAINRARDRWRRQSGFCIILTWLRGLARVLDKDSGGNLIVFLRETKGEEAILGELHLLDQSQCGIKKKQKKNNQMLKHKCVQKVRASPSDLLCIFPQKQQLLYLQLMVWLHFQVLVRGNNHAAALVFASGNLRRSTFFCSSHLLHTSGDKQTQTGSTDFNTFIFQFVPTQPLPLRSKLLSVKLGAVTQLQTHSGTHRVFMDLPPPSPIL